MVDILGYPNIKVAISAIKKIRADFTQCNVTNSNDKLDSNMYFHYMEEIDDARGLIERAGFPSDHIWDAIALLTMADIKNNYALGFFSPNLQNRYWNQAASIYKQILSRFEKHLGYDNYWAGKTLINWGTIMRKGSCRPTVNRSQKRLKRGIAILRRSFKRENHKEILMGQLSLSKAQYYSRKIRKAEKRCLQSENLLKDTFGLAHPLLKHVYVILRQIYFLTNWANSYEKYFEYTDKCESWESFHLDKLVQDHDDYGKHWEFRRPILLSLSNAIDYEQYMKDQIIKINTN